MPKKRITLRIDTDEIAIVGPTKRWEHLITTYEFLATMFPEYENSWLEAADWIRCSIAHAQREGSDDRPISR